ncbi:MAG: FAD binding domain-containing protein [Alphaproteobacteria bacterium]|nr:FAD binding domain-containing protein [Alphaproteobacteria bacterium]
MALAKLEAFHVPDSVDAALALLKDSEEALPLAGGTFLRGLDARGLLSEVEALVDIRKAGLSGLRLDDAEFEIGATVPLAAIAALEAVRTEPWLAALREALSHPPMQVRNTATIGGCVAASCPFFDAPTALLALDAEVIVRGAGGMRRMALAALFGGMFVNTLGKGEIVTAVVLPVPTGRCASGFVKLAGNANDLAIVNAAARLTLDADGICTDARVALGGGVGEQALRSAAAEAVLAGSRPEADVLARAADAVVGEIDALADHRASAAYRVRMAKVMTRRALERALACVN